MRKVLLVVFAAFVPLFAAFAQEPAGKADIGVAPHDSLQPAPGSGISTGISPFEMPSFMQEKDFRTGTAKEPAVVKTPDMPRLKVSDELYNALPEPYVKPLPHDPYAHDFNRGGAYMFWNSGMLLATSFRNTMPGLLSRHNASVTAVQNVGRLTFEGTLSADRYLLWHGTQTMFGVSGAVTYHFNDNVSATLFGNYYTGISFHSMAAMPYFGTKGYGGYLTFMGSSLGIDLGVQRHYDSFARRWVTSPIITPKIKFSEKFTLDLPVGWLVKEVLDEKVFKSNRKASPMIMPEVGPMPGPVPFGAPEMPR